MAIAGDKPIVAIYSTFLQRGDQLIHDAATGRIYPLCPARPCRSCRR
ncbi:hypothetical protein O9993_09920 [Vibrio lentus]|nr:hypothetical protein [Vibrio lentus]